jgi:hypothetical protein
MSSFSIPDIPPKTELNKGSVDAVSGAALSPHSGAVQFAVNNGAGEIIDGKLSVLPDGQAKPEWFTIDGDAQRDFGTSGSETVKVNVSVPADVAQGDYSFRLQVAAVTDPDNEFARSPSTAFTVPVAEKTGGKKKSKWWLWLLLGLLALAIIGGVVYALTRPKPPIVEPPKESPSPTAEPSTAAIPDLVGKTLDQAKGLAQDFDLTPVAGAAEGKQPDTILKQSPESGTTQNKGIPLKVTFDPGVVVPAELIGKTAEQSINILGRAGLHVQETRTACRSSGTDGQIVETTPAPNTRVAKDTGVTVHIAVIGGTIGTRRFGCGVRIEDLQILRFPVTEATFVPVGRATFAPRIQQ